MANTLADYLISIGFDVKGDEQQKLKNAVREGAFQANVLFEAVKKSVEAFHDMMVEFADGFEQMFYASIRTRTAVQNIQALQAAAAKTGSSAEQANAALESFAKWLRTTPGGDRLAKQWSGVNDQLWRTMDTSQKLVATIEGISKHFSYPVQSRFQEMFGIPEQFWLSVQSPEFGAFQKKLKEIQASIGVDSKKAAEGAKDLNNSLRDLGVTMDAIGQKATSDSFGQYTEGIKQLQQFLQENGKDIADTISKLAKAILEFVTDLMKINGTLPLLHDMVELLNFFAHALKLVADQFDRLMNNPLAKTILGGTMSGVGAMLPGGLGSILGLGGILGGDDGEPGGGAGGSGSGGSGSGGGSWWDKTKRWYQNNAPRWAGGRGGGDGTQAPAPGAQGQYRPVYKLQSGDLSDAVINKIAGEAQNNVRSTDAVISNMINRIGTKGYGPSGSLAEVAYAPGQYTGYARADARRAAFIRSRIEAIAAGQVADPANGANEYRASSYNGPWAWHHADAPVIGGNRFAYNPDVAAGPYAPYRVPRAGSRGVPAADWSSMLGLSAAAAPVDRAARYNAFGDLSGATAAFGVQPYPPAGSGGNTTHQHTSSLDQKTTINVYGVGDGNEDLGAKVSKHQANLNADLLRNMQNSSVG